MGLSELPLDNDQTSASLYYAAFALGVALHIFVFRIGEWDLWTTQFVVAFLATQLVSVAASAFGSSGAFAATLTAFIPIYKLAWSLLLGIWTSMLIYRGFFHRLSRFPGPFAARLSNFYVTWLSAKKLHLYEEVQELHKRYGDYIRLGPSELSINDSAAIPAILGPQSTCTKGPWYNVLHPMVSLQTVRGKTEHIPRRKVWDQGFSAKALRDYEPRIIDYTNQLLAQLSKQEDQPIDVSDWSNFYSFDVMGDLAWGKSFGMLQHGVKHYFMNALHADMTNIGLFGHLIWLFPIVKATPILNSENKKFLNWLGEQVADRRKMKPSRPDVFSWLLEYHERPGQRTAQEELNLQQVSHILSGDAYLIAVAGSDTTAASLTCMFFELVSDPKILHKLQQEVDQLFDSTEKVDAVSLSTLRYMDAVINETLRLHPPVPSGVQRMTPAEGLTVGTTFIPGNTIVQIPTHTTFRDERYFESPDDFIPERWITRRELNKDETVFIPFSSGRSSCVGKQLALMEIRYVASQILRRYNVSFAPTQDPGAFLQAKRDTFTLALGPLNLVFTPRK
ncbi:benzoate 4-monooxygenase cytochrome P450 [Xylariales sp. PMI_506]|nr:benzoate 4-monooxygenase cytochrome P450 [Xylariales sp. PMI_506]